MKIGWLSRDLAIPISEIVGVLEKSGERSVPLNEIFILNLDNKLRALNGDLGTGPVNFFTHLLSYRIGRLKR